MDHSLTPCKTVHSSSRTSVEPLFFPTNQSVPPLFCLAELHDAFILFDVNHDGRITESELQSVLSFLGIKASTSDVKKMIADADIDGKSWTTTTTTKQALSGCRLPLPYFHYMYFASPALVSNPSHPFAFICLFIVSTSLYPGEAWEGGG